MLPAMNVYDCRYLYLIDVQLTAGGGDVLHLDSCQYVLLRGVRLVGTGDIANYSAPDETLKANQCSHVFVESSDISGAVGNALDFVAVQYGHIVDNRLHHANDWCAYLKGGSSYFRLEANEIYDCGTGGFTAGQGTGFEFMVPPWLHYEAENLKMINNVVHDTWGAGLGVNGGYNILFAYNTLYRVGQRSHAVEFVFGGRECDGDSARCNQNLAAGGWGGIPGAGEQPVPNRDVYFYNNVVYNPAGYQSQWIQFAIYGPQTPLPASNIPSPSLTDANLQIRGNVIWNGPADESLGLGDTTGCQPSNPACNASQILRDNAINTVEPRLADPAEGNFALAAGVTAPGAVAIPDFTGGDAPTTPPAPPGNLANQVARDWSGQARLAGGPPGAVAVSSAGPAAGLFVPLAPCRVMDTRAGSGSSGAFGQPALSVNTRRDIPVQASACGVPANATVYSLNLTVIPQQPFSDLVAWPAGQPQPGVSNLHSTDAGVVADTAIVAGGTGGAISVLATGNTDLVIDINGYFAPPGASSLQFFPMTPCRVIDTRSANGSFGSPYLAGYVARDFPFLQSSCGISGLARAYSLNVTVVPKGTLWYVTAGPAGQPLPLVSALNDYAGAGVPLANAAIVPAGTNGSVDAHGLTGHRAHRGHERIFCAAGLGRAELLSRGSLPGS